MKKIFALLIALCLIPAAYAGDDISTIESAVSLDGGTFVMNGVEFAAKGFCPDFQFGDGVIFLTGNPNGECTEALVQNLRTNQTCDVWCQYPL